MKKQKANTTCASTPKASKAKSAVMQPKYRMQVVQSEKRYQRKKDKQQINKNLRKEVFLFLGDEYCFLTRKIQTWMNLR